MQRVNASTQNCATARETLHAVAVEPDDVAQQRIGDTKKTCLPGQSIQGNFFLLRLALATPAWDALAWVWTACSASASSKRIFEKSFPTDADK